MEGMDGFHISTDYFLAGFFFTYLTVGVIIAGNPQPNFEDLPQGGWEIPISRILKWCSTMGGLWFWMGNASIFHPEVRHG